MVKKIKSFLFENKTTKQTIAKNTFWLTFGNIIGRLLRVGIVVYAARILGAEGWGLFSYAIGLIAFLTIFTDLGIRAVLTREVAKDNNEEKTTRILSTSLFIEFALIAISALVVIFIAPHLTALPGAKEILLITLTVLVFDSLREFGFAVIRATEKMEWEAGIFILANLSIAVFGVIFLQISPTVKSFTLAYSVGTGVGTVAVFYVLRGHLKKLVSSFSTKLIKPILSSGWPFAVSAMLGGLLINIDILIIGFYRTATEVGFYSAALRPVQLLYIIPSILAISIFPAMSRLANKAAEAVRSVLEQSITLVFLAAIPIALGGVVLGREIISLLFGSEFIPATASFQILIITILVNFPAVILSDAIFAHDKQKILIRFVAIAGVINVIFDFILIPKFGIVGSAWTTLLAQAIGNIYLWHKTRQINHFRVLRHLKKILLSSIIMTVAVWFMALLGFNVIINIILSAIIYLGILAIMKESLISKIKSSLIAKITG